VLSCTKITNLKSQQSLGYLSNPFGFKWDDKTTINKVNSFYSEANYPSIEYEKAAMNVFFSTIKTKKGFLFFLLTLFAKFYAILILIFQYLQFGVFLLFYPRKLTFIDVAFVLALFSGCIFGMVGFPIDSICLGVVSICFVYLIYVCSLFSKEDLKKPQIIFPLTLFLFLLFGNTIVISYNGGCFSGLTHSFF
jgi:hypothetical protein